MRGHINKVLILGCGTVGQIKARIWLSLGMDVYLYDSTPSQVDKLLMEDVRLKRFLQDDVEGFMVDISTPSNQHASSLQWTLNTLKNPSMILVEKPICTNIKDKAKIIRLLDTNKKVPVYVNESYFWSSTLDWLLNRLLENNENIISIGVNLSKNRLPDTHAGRFFDKELESYGIELPHAIAILQKLGIDINRLTIIENILYRSDVDFFNQGVSLVLTDKNGTKINIDSFLGNFMIHEDEKVPNYLTRWLSVETNKQNTYHVLFDPVPNEQRFKSAIIINGNDRIVLEDDHLRKHLQNTHGGEVDNTMKQYLSPANSIAIYDFLKKLYNNKIENRISDSIVQYNEVGE